MSTVNPTSFELQIDRIAKNIPGVLFQLKLSPAGHAQLAFISDKCSDIFAVDSQELRDQPELLLELVYVEDRGEIRHLLEAAGRKLSSINWIGRVLNRQSELRWINLHCAPHRTDSDELYWDGVIIDITQIKAFQNKLNRKEYELRHLLQAVPDLVFKIDEEHRVQYINRGFSEFESHDLIGRSLFDCIPIDVHDKVRQILDLAEKTPGLLLEQEYSGRFPDEHSKRYYYQRILHLEKSNQATETLVLIQDITESKQQRQRAEILNRIVEASQDIVVYFDQSGYPVYLNPSARKILGSAESIGQVQNIFALDSRDEFCNQIIPKLISEGKPWEGEAEFETAMNGQTIPVWLRLLGPESADEGWSFALMATNLSEIKHKEDQMLQSSKLATIGEMASSLAHEINNPLAVIQASVRKLYRSIDDNSTSPKICSRVLGVIEDSVYRIADVISQLREFIDQQKSDQRQIISIEKLVRDTMSLCRRAIQSKSVAVQTFVSDADTKVYCAPAQVSQILLGLIHNSIEAIGSKDRAWISIDLKDQGDDLQVIVTDSGPGIPRAIQKEINRPFFTTKAGMQATGLGLSIGRRLAMQNGGSLELDEQSSNTRFVLTLPKYAPKQSDPE